MKKRIISFILTLTLLFSFVSVYASAAREEEFLSDVALVYEDSVEEARAAIEGTDWKLFEQDLNPNADYMFDEGVYLIYKTSTDVEDAITDLRVMDMYGGYSTANYEKQLEASRDFYERAVDYLRVTMYEFKELYNKGDEMAKIAYRQMNYYKDSDTNKLMGDFFLERPSDDELITVMMEGNAYAVTNLITLLAVGISGGGNGTLAERIAANYGNKDKFNSSVYYDIANLFIEDFTELAAIVKRYDALADQYDLTDEKMSEDEYDFLLNYASVAFALEEITYGEGTLKDFIVKDNLSVQDLCPILGAFTEGQLALADIGVLTTVLQYNSPTPTDELYKLLDETEKNLKDENGNLRIIDVYLGVDRSIFEGNFAFTAEAERQQALSGNLWKIDDTIEANRTLAIAGYHLALTTIGFTFLTNVVGKIAISLGEAAVKAAGGATFTTYQTIAYKVGAFFYGDITASGSALAVFNTLGICLLLTSFGLLAISVWYGYYNPDYTPIPNTMVDVRETDLGDKYIKYTAAKVFGDEDGRNADLNAYEGKEWNALYYTKDATAGSCLTPKFVYKDNDSTIARRHQGISMFGETEAFNLNSHVFNDDAPGVYVTMRYSTTKKAAADVPGVVGSMFSDGALYALTALGGAAVGVGATFAVGALKRKKEESDTKPSV